MKKPNAEYYREIRALLATYEPSLVVAFDEKVNACPPLEVYMWLEGLPRSTRLWEALDPLLTDFFYSNH